MRQLLLISWRSLWRHRRRTLLTVLSLAGALTLAVYFLAIADGMYGRLLHDVLRLQAGHLTVAHARHLETPSIDLRLEQVDALRARLSSVPGVETTKVLIVGQAVASSGEGATGVAVAGVESDTERRLSPLPRRIKVGRYLETADQQVAVVGETLARRLELGVGSKLVLSANDVDGQLVQQMVRVCGIFATGSLELDGHFIQVPIGFSRTLFSMSPTEATEVGLILDDPDRQREVRDRVQALLSREQSVGVWPWQELLPELATFMQVDKGSNYVFQLIMLVMAMFTIFNTIVMSALERKREFSVMLALGTPQTRVQLQLLTEALFLGLLGAFVGVGLASIAALASDGVSLTAALGDGLDVGGFLVDPVLRPRLSWMTTVGVGGAMVLVTMMMSLVPMSRIGRITVRDVLR